ncbi:hypothetical protein BY458DRAFT_533077 [Sporodiniella umbellata]|nr:hypothetical protein BY458DRAFT_533077 [Sporodiniella umbellata]
MERQKTFGIVPLKLKDEIKEKTKERGIRMTTACTIQTANELTLHFDISKKELPVFAFALQGKDVVDSWLELKNERVTEKVGYFYASGTLADAEQDLVVFQAIVEEKKKSAAAAAAVVDKKEPRPLATKKKLASGPRQKVENSSSREKSEGGTKKTDGPKRAAPKGSRVSTPASLEAPVKKTATRTESPRKPKKKAEKKESSPKPVKVAEKKKEEEVPKPEESKEEKGAMEPVGVEPESGEEVERELEIGQTQEALLTSQELEPVSYLSTCSSALSDEHDAEVAAATHAMGTHSEDSERYSPIKGRSSTLSANSATSLSRPETPEVHEIKIRFEQAQQEKPVSRPPSKMSNEIQARIKDMKPRDPTGTKVKSMVSFFMDENLNKWEF